MKPRCVNTYGGVALLSLHCWSFPPCICQKTHPEMSNQKKKKYYIPRKCIMNTALPANTDSLEWYESWVLVTLVKDVLNGWWTHTHTHVNGIDARLQRRLTQLCYQTAFKYMCVYVNAVVLGNSCGLFFVVNPPRRTHWTRNRNC